LSGCGTGALWDKFTAKDDTFNEDRPDKLYNEGLYLMNQRKDNKAASKKFEEVDRQHPYSDWARKSLLMSAYSFYNQVTMTAASAQPPVMSRCIPAVQMRPTRNT
jgi:outer membrane protein assembly factor BamD